VRAITRLDYWFTPTAGHVAPDTINVKVFVNLYEGGSCGTTNDEDYRDQQTLLFLDGSQEMSISVPGNGGGSASLQLNLSYNKN
jgi:hypothetical protein